MRFVYSLVRFVPDPARGEFINVGAIVGSEELSEWSLRQIENPRRARALDDRGALDAAWAFLDRTGHALDEFEASFEDAEESEFEPSEGWLAELASRRRGLVQLSQPAPLIAESAEEALDVVFEEMVIDPERERRRFTSKHPALAAVRRIYRDLGLRKNETFFERVSVETRHHSERIDFAIANGRALQLTQTWSFQVPQQRDLAEHVKAWGWTMREVREHGGRARVGDGPSIEIRPDVDIEVLFVPPRPDQHAPALEDATGVFETLHARGLRLDEAEALAQSARELLG